MLFLRSLRSFTTPLKLDNNFRTSVCYTAKNTGNFGRF